MKKRVFSIFLILALLLTALAGCGQDTGGASRSSDEDGEEQLLASGYYEVCDEDGELVGYLRVTSSKIVVYDERGGEEDTLRYDYSAKKELYTLDGGELFGSEEFTVEKSKKKLKLITEDDDEYTLEEIDKSDLPGGGKTSGNAAEGGSPGAPVELPTGCYAAYNGSTLMGYLKVTSRTMIFYDSEGNVTDELDYSYERDGSCTAEQDGSTITTFRFTYERGSYYMSGGATAGYLLDPVRESEIPVHEGGSSSGTAPAGDPAGGVPDEGYEGRYYIGGNGSMDLYAWLPEGLYDSLYANDYEDGRLISDGEYYDSDTGAELVFSAILASGDALQEAIEEAMEETKGSYGAVDELLYDHLRDSLTESIEDGYIAGAYLGDDVDYDLEEGRISIGSRDWRFCNIYVTGGDTEVYVSLLFWMDGYDMAVVGICGIAERSSGPGEMYNIVDYIKFTLALDT